MKQFLAAKDSDLIYAQHKTFTLDEVATDPGDLEEGAIGVYAIGDAGKFILIDAAADFLDVKKFYIARGLAAGCILSDEIERKSVDIEKAAAASGVAKVITLGGSNSALMAGDATNAIGDTAGVVVVDNSFTRTFEWTTKAYEVKLPTANMTAAAIAALLVAEINADPKRIVEASTSGATTAGTLILTRKVTGKTFDVNGLEETRTASPSKTITTQPVKAIGTVTNLEALQLECHGYQGGTRRGDGVLGDTASYNQLDAAINDYILYHFRWIGHNIRTGVPNSSNAERFKRLFLAIPTGSPAITAFETILVAAAEEEVAAQAEEQGS